MQCLNSYDGIYNYTTKYWRKTICHAASTVIIAMRSRYWLLSMDTFAWPLQWNWLAHLCDQQGIVISIGTFAWPMRYWHFSISTFAWPTRLPYLIGTFAWPTGYYHLDWHICATNKVLALLNWYICVTNRVLSTWLAHLHDQRGIAIDIKRGEAAWYFWLTVLSWKSR